MNCQNSDRPLQTVAERLPNIRPYILQDGGNPVYFLASRGFFAELGRKRRCLP
jgi:hypothetical protein